MPPSYHADDLVYQKLRAAGKRSWDQQANPDADFDTFILRPFLEESLGVLGRPAAGLSALEVGCGSGPVCCFLAARGLTVRGIDVSPTAIEMARQHAAERGLNVQFDGVDICALPGQADRYDLIIDGHCLHCIVGEEDRRGALACIYGLLKPDGLFLMETMIAHPALVVAGKYRIDPRGLLTIAVDEPGEVDGAQQEDGQWFVPYRRLLTETQVTAGLEEVGFRITHRRTTAQADTRKPMLMQIRAAR